MLAIRNKTNGRLLQVYIDKELRYEPYCEDPSAYAELELRDSQFPGIPFVVNEEMRDGMEELINTGFCQYWFDSPARIWYQYGDWESNKANYEIVEVDIIIK